MQTSADDANNGKDNALTLFRKTQGQSNTITSNTDLYYPSMNDYYFVGFEDLYPTLGDYDFNDLVMAYRVAIGFKQK